jgi:hypothetical protein
MRAFLTGRAFCPTSDSVIFEYHARSGSYPNVYGHDKRAYPASSHLNSKSFIPGFAEAKLQGYAADG